jgi:ubiquinone biosynthesis protein
MLGGYYLKAGQMLVGMRLLPPQMEQELEVLQDKVPPRPVALIRAIIEDELGCPVDQVFASFDDQAIGAASIGQVHRATLLDGTEVVVKVRYAKDVQKKIECCGTVAKPYVTTTTTTTTTITTTTSTTANACPCRDV